MDGIAQRRVTRSARIGGWLAAAIWCLAVWPVAAQTAGEIRVARLVDQLGAPEAAARHAATDALMALGSASRAQLEQAQWADDPEVRLRARALLEEYRTEDLWLASQVEVRAGELSSVALATISAQTGNRLLTGDTYGTFQDKPLATELSQAPFWPAVDALCQQTGNHLRPHYDVRSGGFVICGGSPGRFPSAYAGPLRAQITGARRVFVEELDYSDRGSEVTHTFQFNLQMMWEERFALVGYTTQPELIEARTDSGEQLTVVQPAASSWNALTAGARHVTTTLRLSPPPAASAKLDVLRLRWQLLANGDRTSLVVANPMPGRSYAQDDVELSVESLERQPSGRYELVLIISRDRPLPEPAEILFQEQEVELFDAAGRPLRLQNHTHQLVDRGVQMKLQFAPESGAQGPAMLRLSYPRIRARRGMELVFRDVPLPTARLK